MYKIIIVSYITKAINIVMLREINGILKYFAYLDNRTNL